MVGLITGFATAIASNRAYNQAVKKEEELERIKTLSDHSALQKKLNGEQLGVFTGQLFAERTITLPDQTLASIAKIKITKNEGDGLPCVYLPLVLLSHLSDSVYTTSQLSSSNSTLLTDEGRKISLIGLNHFKIRGKRKVYEWNAEKVNSYLQSVGVKVSITSGNYVVKIDYIPLNEKVTVIGKVTRDQNNWELRGEGENSFYWILSEGIQKHAEKLQASQFLDKMTAAALGVLSIGIFTYKAINWLKR